MSKVTLDEDMNPRLRKVIGWFIAIVAISIVPLLIVSLYFEENWRGARDWAACQRELEAKGETIELQKLLPPQNPKNDLSKVPIFEECDPMGFPSRLDNIRPDLHIDASST